MVERPCKEYSSHKISRCFCLKEASFNRQKPVFAAVMTGAHRI